MQELAALVALMREISFGILIVGIFYTFGLFLLGKFFSAVSGHGQEIEHDADHDVDHAIEKDFGHDVDHDLDHDVDHAIEHDMDHDVDHDMDHTIEKDYDHAHDYPVEKDVDHDTDIGHGIGEGDYSGFFEIQGGPPLGVTIGTGLVGFGFLGVLFYSDSLFLPFFPRFGIHILGVFLSVFTIRFILGKVFVESGFLLRPRHLVGRKVEAATTIRDDFGEVRIETEMGLRRFHAKSLKKEEVYKKGTMLYVISADETFVYVHSSEELLRSQSSQGKVEKED